jgi:cytochrome c peroxidase
MSCKKDSVAENEDVLLEFQIPEHFPEPWYQFGKNTLSKEGIELGRKLFYDPLLSENGMISCGSCHHQEAGFSDPGVALSIGTQGKPGFRNSTALANMAWMPTFMADGGINHIEIMPLAPLTDSLEMNEELSVIINKLNKHQEYPDLFEAAFDDDSITDQQMFWALAQFMSTMISASSKYDQVYQGLENFEPAEKRGYELFKANCASCHKEPLLTDFSFRNNGLDSISADPGRSRITLKEEDRGKFKVPGLRNIELSPPYMHDGRFSSLREVIDHYNEGLANPANLDPAFEQPMNMSEQEKQDLLAFLKTLTDYEYITKTSLSDPNQ